MARNTAAVVSFQGNVVSFHYTHYRRPFIGPLFLKYTLPVAVPWRAKYNSDKRLFAFHLTFYIKNWNVKIGFRAVHQFILVQYKPE